MPSPNRVLAQPDAKLIAWLGIPDPPHRFLPARSRARLVLGYSAVALLIAIGLALPIAYFGTMPIGQGLLVDTALAVGVGTPLPAARIEPGACRNNAARAGSKVPGQWECPFTIDLGHRRAERVVATISRYELVPRGAGQVLGAVGVYWSPGILLARWWNDSLSLLMAGGLIAIALLTLRSSRPRQDLALARDARVRTVDLLTWQDRPAFAFIDDEGLRRFGQASSPLFPLILDGVRTTGVALVKGRDALLLDSSLRPLDLDTTKRGDILERAAQVQRQCQVRPLLPRQDDDPPTLSGRIDRLEREMKDRSPSAPLDRLYDDAWRLVWDSNDLDIANRALAARDAIAIRLGPAAAHAALLRAREGKLA